MERLASLLLLRLSRAACQSETSTSAYRFWLDRSLLGSLSAPFIRNAFEIEVAQLYIRYQRVYSFLLRVSTSLQ